MLSARWDQFDLGSALWIKPAATTKQRRLHRAPISTSAAASGQAVAAVPKSLIAKDVAIVDGEMDLPELVQIPFAMYLSSSAQHNPPTLRIATSLGDFIEETMGLLCDQVVN